MSYTGLSQSMPKANQCPFNYIIDPNEDVCMQREGWIRYSYLPVD